MRYLMYMCDHCGYTEVDWNQKYSLTVVRYCFRCQALRLMILVGEGDSIPPEGSTFFDYSYSGTTEALEVHTLTI